MMDKQIVVLRRHEITPLETPGGNRTSVLATNAQGTAEVSVLQQEQEPGGGNPPHYHDHEEVMLLLSGSAAVSVGNQRTELNGGDVLIVPAGVVHNVTTSGADAARWMLVSTNTIRYFKPDGEEIVPEWTQNNIPV